MPREKQFTTEENSIAEQALSADTETKAKTAPAKVTLVKPLQAEEENAIMQTDELVEAEVMEPLADKAAEQAPAPKAKKATRPKVGRPAAARKKKSDDKEPKAEKKPGKPRKKAATAPAAESEAPAELTQQSIAAKAREPEFTLSVPEKTETPLIGMQQETLALELPDDWAPEQHPRPQSFKSILFAVILFVVINLGFMTLFSASHKTKPAPAADTTQTASLPSVAAPKAAVTQLPPIVGTRSAPPAPAVASPDAAPRPRGADAHAATAAPVNPIEVSTLPPAVPAAPPEAAEALAPAAPAPAAATVTAAASAPAVQAEVAAAPSSQPDKATTSNELLSILDKD